jgi:hypothetical protein
LCQGQLGQMPAACNQPAVTALVRALAVTQLR